MQPASSPDKHSLHPPRQHPEDVAKQAAQDSVADISEAVREKLARRMRQAPVLDLDTTDEESASDKKPTPVPKKKTVKSGKLKTANSSVQNKAGFLKKHYWFF